MTTAPYASPTETSSAPAAQPQTSALSIASLICGVIAFLGCSIITGIPAIICGHMAKSRIKKSAGAITGSGMATAGLILGYLSIVIMVLITISIMKQGSAVEMIKDGVSLQSIHTAVLDYEKEFEAYPYDLNQLEIITDKDEEKWTYFPGQDSSSDADNILIASKEYKGGVVITLRINGAIQPLATADYEEAIAAQNAP